VDDLVAALPAADCRFIVYDHEYKAADGRATGKLFFICWNPRRWWWCCCLASWALVH
jgi:hypothetical protein